jgi:YD repeat-containing protein
VFSKAAASKGPRHTQCGMSRVRATRERRWRPVSPSCYRTYQTNGTTTGPFGRGTTHATQIVMLVEGNQRVIRMGDGRRFTLTLQPDGSYRNLTDASLRGTVLTSPGGVPTLRWKDGTRWVFGTTLSGAFGVVNLGLTQQIDRTGNTLTNTWSGTRITAIAGPDGRQLTLDYDGSNRITKVTDPIGRTVQYAYMVARLISSLRMARAV